MLLQTCCRQLSKDTVASFYRCSDHTNYMTTTEPPTTTHSVCMYTVYNIHRGADKSLARPTSQCILFDGENISFDASLVLYIYIYIYI